MAPFGARSSYFLIFSLIAILSSPCRADPDPLQDFCIAILSSAGMSMNGFPCKNASTVTSDDFFFDGLSKEGSTTGVFGSNVTAGNVLSFPGLNTLGLSMNRVDFAPGGVNPPHIHPRATELVVVLKGQLLVGFLTTGNVFFSKVLTVGQSFVFPRGLIHFQYNVGKGKALALTAFNSQLPGVSVVPVNIFASKPSIPDEVLTKAFQVDEQIVKDIRSKFGS